MSRFLGVHQNEGNATLARVPSRFAYAATDYFLETQNLNGEGSPFKPKWRAL
jgi:hypothetical protein